MAAVLYWREGALRVARADMPLLVFAAVLGLSLNQLCFVYSLTDTGASGQRVVPLTVGGPYSWRSSGTEAIPHGPEPAHPISGLVLGAGCVSAMRAPPRGHRCSPRRGDHSPLKRTL